MEKYITPKVKAIDHRKVVADEGTKDPCSGVTAFIAAVIQARTEGGDIYCPAEALPYGFENTKLSGQGMLIADASNGGRMLEPLYGAMRNEIEQAEASGIPVVDSICPVVKRFRQAPAELAAAGFTPVIAGLRDSREVLQAIELAPQPEAVIVIENEADAAALDPVESYGLCLQPHFTLDLAAVLIAVLRKKCDRFRLLDTSCPEARAAYNQARLMALAADVVFIPGPPEHQVIREMAARVAALEKQAVVVDSDTVPEIELHEKLGHIGLTGSPYSSPEQFEKIFKLLKEKYAGGVFDTKWQPIIPNSDRS